MGKKPPIKQIATVKIEGARISCIKANIGEPNPSGSKSGGPMPRLLMTPGPREKQLFSSIQHWSVAISTDWGVVPTRFWVRPKSFGKTGHNVFIREDSGFEDRIIPPELCVNFKREFSIYDVIEHYCPGWSRVEDTYKRVQLEMATDVYLIVEPYSKRGMLVLHDPKRKSPLKKLGFSDSLHNEVMLDSIRHHLARLKLYENVSKFLKDWKFFVEKSREISRDERDIEQKRDDLSRIGIQCYFYRRKGVDSAASKVTLLRDGQSPVEFNIDIESKSDAKNFFCSGEAGDALKYPRLPVLVLCHTDTSKQPPDQYFPHPVICMNNLLQVLIDSPLEMFPLINVAQSEISRLQDIIEGERELVAKEKSGSVYRSFKKKREAK